MVSRLRAEVLREAEAVAAASVAELRAMCGSTGSPFVDDFFPPSDRSLYGKSASPVGEHPDGDGGGPARRPVEITWLPVGEIQHVDDSTEETDSLGRGDGRRWIVVDDSAAGSTDILQGLLGDCWLLSALAVVAERRSLLRKILLTREVNPEGVYAVQLCIGGLWKTVYIDGFFPCRADTRTLVYSQCKRGAQLWVAIIEKALAKEFGSYAALVSGRCLEGLAILTGAPCESHELQSEAMQSQVEERELVWAKLLSGAELGCLMGASCGAGRMTLPDDAYQAVGLYPRHAYSVLQVRSVGSHRLLLLRNPWGRGQWRGRFSPGHASWSELPPKDRQELTDTLTCDGPNSGLFWICYEDLLKYFYSVDVAHCPEGSGGHEARLSCSIRPAEQFEACVMTVLERTALDLVLYQSSSRYTDAAVLRDLCLVVCRGDNDLRPGKIVCHTQRQVRNFTLLSSVVLEPGLYTVACLSFNQWTLNKPVRLTLAAHSAQPLLLLESMQCSSRQWLAELVCNLAEKCSPRCELRPNVYSHNLMTGWAGLICVVVNLDHEKCLWAKCKCSGSRNVGSTRGSLESLDVLPPRHRQVVMLLSQLESLQSAGFSVRQRITHKFVEESQYEEGTQHQPPLNQDVSCLHAVLPLAD